MTFMVTRMKALLLTLLGIALGMVIAFVLVIGVEWFSSIVHPLPPDFQGSMDEMCQHVARYPHWVLAVVVVLWGATAFLSVRVANRIGRIGAGSVVALVLMAAVVFNVAMLPYPVWFKAVMPLAMLGACGVGLRRVRPSISMDVSAS